MKRRDFLKYTGPVGLGSLFLGGFPVKTFATQAMMAGLTCDISDRVMVIIHLKGANDGINTLVPINQYDTYANLRPNIRLSNSGSNSFINLDTGLSNADQVGLHPIMTEFKDLYDSGHLNVVQGVSYHNQNKSHFKSTDLYLTGGDGRPQNFNLSSGWMGRYLNNRYPDFSGSPTSAMPDPLGIQIGDRKPSLGFHTEDEHAVEINLTGQNPSGFFNLVSGLGAEQYGGLGNSDYDQHLQYIMNVENSVNAYAQRISAVFNGGNNAVTYPDTNLANQLKTVARLLAGGSQTKIFLLNHTGFDTHVNQVVSGNTATGNQANLLKQLSEAVKTFMDDLKAMNLDNRVVTTTFSEFGRKAIENGNMGTDHGTLCPMFVIGTPVAGGVSGTNINLSNLDGTGAPDMNSRQHDYRQIFATLLQDWMGANNEAITETRFNGYEKINLIDGNFYVDPGCYIGTPPPVVCTCVKARVLLEGFYHANSGVMTTTLQEDGIIPLNQPYGAAPFNYNGNESVQSFPADTVDWVLLEARSANNINEVVARKAALVRKDGWIWNHDGTEGIAFPDLPEGDYYLTINHRNHLGITSRNTLAFATSDPIDYSFCEAGNAARGREMQIYRNGKFLMRAGDTNGDGIISGRDSNVVKVANGQLDEYSNADLNADGVVNTSDLGLWRRNKSKVGDSLILK